MNSVIYEYNFSQKKVNLTRENLHDCMLPYLQKNGSHENFLLQTNFIKLTKI